MKRCRVIASCLPIAARRSAGALLCAAWAVLLAAPANAQYEPPKQVTVSPTGVDLAAGRFSTSNVDLSIGPLKLERSYLGGQTIKGSDYFGLNWTHNYSVYVVEGDTGRGQADKTFVVIGRSTVHFTKLMYFPGQYSNSNPDSFGTTLTVVGGAFVYTDRDGNVYTFNPAVNAFPPVNGQRNQRVARIDYADGHTLTYSYDANSRLTQISSNYGYSLVFEYGPSGYVSRACGYNRATTYVSATPNCVGAALAVSYAYPATTWVNLTSFTDAMGQVWGYDYAGTSNVSQMTCVRQVNSSSCLVSNAYPEGLLSQQTTADGGIWNYAFDRPVKRRDDEPPPQPGEPPAYSAGSYSDPEGLNVAVTFGGGLLSSYTESFGGSATDPWSRVGRTTAFTWDGVELNSLAHPEGNKLRYGRDGRQNIISETWSPKPGSPLAPVSRSSVFPDSGLDDCTSVVRKICNKPVSKTDYNGNQTSYSYDPAHGGVLTETAPADADGLRSVKRYAYVQRYAWIWNGGGYSPAATPVWLLATEKMCRSSATVSGACAAGAGDEVTTTYDYGPDSGPNTLLLRGKVVTADGISLRTCYGYDMQGNRISETSPRAGLTVCP